MTMIFSVIRIPVIGYRQKSLQWLRCYRTEKSHLDILSTRCWALNKVQTHAGHSIAFNGVLHFVTLWPWPLTFWPNIKWSERTNGGLSLWQVWWLWFHPFWFVRADTQIDESVNHTHRQGWFQGGPSEISAPPPKKKIQDKAATCQNFLLKL